MFTCIRINFLLFAEELLSLVKDESEEVNDDTQSKADEKLDENLREALNPLRVENEPKQHVLSETEKSDLPGRYYQNIGAAASQAAASAMAKKNLPGQHSKSGGKLSEKGVKFNDVYMHQI